MQLLQSIITRTFTNADWFIRNNQIHRELKVKIIDEFVEIGEDKIRGNKQIRNT